MDNPNLTHETQACIQMFPSYLPSFRKWLLHPPNQPSYAIIASLWTEKIHLFPIVLQI